MQGASLKTEEPSPCVHPLAIIRMKDGRLNVVGVSNIDGKTSLVSVELNTIKDINDKYSAYNLVVSMFSPRGNYLKNNIQKNAKAVEYTKNDLEQVNPQLHNSLSTFNTKSSTDGISSKAEYVKRSAAEDDIRYSKKDNIKLIPQEDSSRVFEMVRKKDLSNDRSFCLYCVEPVGKGCRIRVLRDGAILKYATERKRG